MPIASILALIQAASVLLPELEEAIPLVRKAIDGSVTAADIEAMDKITASLNAQAAADVAQTSKGASQTSEGAA